MRTPLLSLGLIAGLAFSAPAASLDHDALTRAMQAAVKGFPGRVGACVQSAKGLSCVDADGQYSLQSVMKMVTSFAVLEAVQQGRVKLDEQILVKPSDLSVYVQPIAEKVGRQGARFTVSELMWHAVTESDSAAVDVLVARLGGIGEAQAALKRLKVEGVRLDRDEKHLQSEVAGIVWKAEYADAKRFEAAIAAVPAARRTAAWEAYRKDPRDTATPRGMAATLYRLATGQLLDAAGTKHLLGVMEETSTGKDRLRAGLAPGWRLAHKTGTSGQWQGLHVATNDVGVMIAPDGTKLAIAVFVADTKADDAARAAMIARMAAETVAHYGK